VHFATRAVCEKPFAFIKCVCVCVINNKLKWLIVETVCFVIVYVVFRGDNVRAYHEYVNAMGPMENQLRDAQEVCNVFIMF